MFESFLFGKVFRVPREFFAWQIKRATIFIFCPNMNNANINMFYLNVDRKLYKSQILVSINQSLMRLFSGFYMKVIWFVVLYNIQQAVLISVCKLCSCCCFSLLFLVALSRLRIQSQQKLIHALNLELYLVYTYNLLA